MFFTPTAGFTHHASFWGIPCYYKDDPPDGCTLAGTNVIYDWIILHVVPWCFMVTEYIRAATDPDFEPSDWPILVKGPIE